MFKLRGRSIVVVPFQLELCYGLLWRCAVIPPHFGLLPLRTVCLGKNGHFTCACNRLARRLSPQVLTLVARARTDDEGTWPFHLLDADTTGFVANFPMERTRFRSISRPLRCCKKKKNSCYVFKKVLLRFNPASDGRYFWKQQAVVALSPTFLGRCCRFAAAQTYAPIAEWPISEAESCQKMLIRFTIICNG
ncbi:hypothetical protein D918_01781 [Trichuris suis]|nr:hypothetical protein D918_01781 [Trichuris suis]